MSAKTFIKKIPFVGPFLFRAFFWIRAVAIYFTSKAFIKKYLVDNAEVKLHVGAGGHGIPGWLNTAIFPTYWPTLCLDATKTFPLPDQSVDYIFTEHMIEHITAQEAENMIRECARVLKPGGKIRIATPDIKKMATMILYPELPEVKAYLEWSKSFYRYSGIQPLNVRFANQMFYSHCHRFLYDDKSLQALVEAYGFCEVQFFSPGVSDTPNLANLEVHHHILGELANDFETLVIEAKK